MLTLGDRLGELVLLNKAKSDENPAEGEVTPDTACSTTTDSNFLSPDLEKLDIGGRSALSSVFGKSPSRSPSPSLGRFHLHRRTLSYDSSERQRKRAEKNDKMARWLEGGNVIYKSVGMSLMDLTVGMHLVRFAREKGVGSSIEGF